MTDELKDPKEPSIADLIKAAQAKPLSVTPHGFQKAEQLLEKWPGSDGNDDHGRGAGGDGEESAARTAARKQTERAQEKSSLARQASRQAVASAQGGTGNPAELHNAASKAHEAAAKEHKAAGDRVEAQIHSDKAVMHSVQARLHAGAINRDMRGSSVRASMTPAQRASADSKDRADAAAASAKNWKL